MNLFRWVSAHKRVLFLFPILILATYSSPLLAAAIDHSAKRENAVVPLPVNSSASTNIVFLPLVRRAPPASAYWGALIHMAYPSTENMQPGGPYDTFETMVQKKMAIMHWGESWKRAGVYDPFDTSYYDNVRNHGSIPMISWASRDSSGGVNQPDFQLSDIYNGVHDAYIRSWAQTAKAWGHPFFLRFDWEMNGYWQFPWAEQVNGNQPGDYVKAWRHVHDIFTQVGATNATWVWCPNIAGPNTTPFSAVYPGDAYVDWTCLDGYNDYNVWISFATVFTGAGINWILDSYSQILAVAPNKPLMIGETASLEAGDGGAMKAAWIKDAYQTQIPVNLPRIKAIVWFNSNDNNPAYVTLPVQSSQASINAFAASIGSTFYAANTFSNLNTSPIPAPP